MFNNRNTNKNARIYLITSLLLSTLLIMSCRVLSTASRQPLPTQESARVEPSAAPALPTATILPPTETPVAEPPVGFKEYQDSDVGVSIYIPEGWTETSIIQGQYAIFLSYPEDKYVGGEVLESGDTKCDLSIRQQSESMDDLIQQWKSSDMTTILSEQEIILSSGQSGLQFELDSMGRSNILVTEINGRIIVLTCFGDFTQFNEIAVSLSAVK